MIADDQSEVIAFLMCMLEGGAGADHRVETVRTHISILFLCGDRALKLKRAVRFFGKIDIFTRVAHVRLVQNRINRMRQRLIDAAPCHHIAAEKQTQRHASP